MEPSRTALIVAIPEAEPAVHRHRATLDTAASWGVPAHITVLYPFLPPHRIDPQTIAALRDTLAAVPRFTTILTHTDWFADTVVWLAPRPDQPFRDLTQAVWRRFPDTPPYAGAHTDVVPHLTIGHDAPRAALRQAEAAVTAHLPITAVVDSVQLITGTPDQRPWRTIHAFPLGAQRGR